MKPNETEQMKNQIERQISLLDGFDHPKMTDTFIEQTVGKMVYVSTLHRWLSIAGRVAVAACILVGIIWFTFDKFNASVPRSSQTKIAYTEQNNNIDEQIDMLYDELDNTITLSTEFTTQSSDKLDKIGEDIKELDREINNG